MTKYYVIICLKITDDWSGWRHPLLGFHHVTGLKSVALLRFIVCRRYGVVGPSLPPLLCRLQAMGPHFVYLAYYLKYRMFQRTHIRQGAHLVGTGPVALLALLVGAHPRRIGRPFGLFRLGFDSMRTQFVYITHGLEKGTFETCMNQNFKNMKTCSRSGMSRLHLSVTSSVAMFEV